MAVEWDEIQPAASAIFNIWNSGGDLTFAKECWGHLAKAGLTSDDGVIARTKTFLRLVALRLIYGGFCAAKWEENADSEIVSLTDDLDLDRIAVGLLAARDIENGGEEFSDEYDLREASLNAAVGVVRFEVFNCVRNAYGGQTGLYRRLSRTAGDEDEADEPEEYDDDDDSDFDPTGDNMDAFDYLERGE